LKPGKEIRHLIKYGYAPPFHTWPPRSERPDNKSARDPEFRSLLKDTLDELERTNAIARVSFKPWCVLPLQLVHRVGKASRVVIDGSFQINPYLRERKVKLTTLKEFNQGVLAGDVWASLDLRSGYYHVGIHPDYRSLFGIKWVEAGKVQYYVWLVCFLGIADLVRTFTKLFKPILGHLHCNGV
jgi:hypothetical protein